jgi:hypothetical protein
MEEFNQELDQNNHALINDLIRDEAFMAKRTQGELNAMLNSIATNNHIEGELNAMLNSIATNNHIEIKGVKECCNIIIATLNATNGTHDGQAFSNAAREGHTNMVKHLCEIEGYLDGVQSGEKSWALYNAIMNGHHDIVEHLSNIEGYLAERQQYFGGLRSNDAFLKAATDGNLKTMETMLFITNKAVSLQDPTRDNAFIAAATNGHIEILRIWREQEGYTTRVSPAAVQIAMDNATNAAKDATEEVAKQYLDIVKMLKEIPQNGVS